MKKKRNQWPRPHFYYCLLKNLYLYLHRCTSIFEKKAIRTKDTYNAIMIKFLCVWYHRISGTRWLSKTHGGDDDDDCVHQAMCSKWSPTNFVEMMVVTDYVAACCRPRIASFIFRKLGRGSEIVVRTYLGARATFGVSRPDDDGGPPSLKTL